MIFKSQYSLLYIFAGFAIFLGSLSCSSEEPQIYEPPKKQEELGKARVFLTTGDQGKLLSEETALTITTLDNGALSTIQLFPEEKLQQIEGFGAALTGSSAFLIHQKLNHSQRGSLLKELFSKEDGIGLFYLRLTMGASDFSLSNYTYNDLPQGETDYDLDDFSIAKDKQDIVPVLKEILAINQNIRIMGSPWSPPAWMKTNGSLMAGELKREAYGVYAKYFVRYVQAYQQEGISIAAITVQNEPLHATVSYPSMYMSSGDQNVFIRQHLGPAFAAQDINTDIVVYDHNWDNTAYPMDILNDPETKKFVAGSAFHGYGGDVNAMSQVHNAHPDKGIYFTEISGGEWATNFSDNLQWNMRHVFIGTTKNWSKNVLLWNLALDERHGPTNNGCQDCRGVVTIDSQTGEVTRNVEYYSLAHFSKFIPPGSNRISSQSSGNTAGLENVAFLTPEGERVLVLANDNPVSREVKIVEKERQIIYNLPSKSVATIVWKD